MTNPLPNIFSATKNIQRLSQQSLWKEAIGALQSQMLDVALQPDPVAFTVTLASVRESGQWLPAMQLYDQILKCCVQSNVIIFNTIISSFYGHWELALAMLRGMPDILVNPDDVSFNTVTWQSIQKAFVDAGQLWQFFRFGVSALRERFSMVRCNFRCGSGLA